MRQIFFVSVLLVAVADVKSLRGDHWPICNSQYELNGKAHSVAIPRCRDPVVLGADNSTIQCGKDRLCGVYCFDHASDPPVFDCGSEGASCSAMAWALPLTALCGIGMGWAITFCYYRKKYGVQYSGYIEVN